MENLEQVKKIDENGRYQYIGFLLEKTDTFEKDENDVIISKTLGVMLVFFKDENDNIVFVRNTDIIGAGVEQPYGEFQHYVSQFTHNFNISIDKDNKYSIKP